MTDEPKPSPPKGRPTLNADEKLGGPDDDYIVKAFRVRGSQWDKLNARMRASGESMAEVMRGYLDEDTPTPAVTQDADPYLITALNQTAVQLAKIGNNVNQMTRDVHRGADFHAHWRDVAAQLEKDLEQARAVMSQLLGDAR